MLEKAILAWKEIPGVEVLTQEEELERYHHATGDRVRRIPVALKVSESSQIRNILDIAQAHNVSLYPISTGLNWGYGTANPVVDDCAILDMSLMNRIVEFDAELGIVTVEPGVTQGQLYAYIQERSLPFLVPTTGTGPRASIMGNALERGYGVAPYTDHFGAVTAIEVILPNGRTYRPPLTELGSTVGDRIYKYGLGAYLDGIFTQSNLGIVTQLTIALARAPEHSEMFVFWISRDEELEEAVAMTKEILAEYPGTVPFVKMLNQLRAYAISYPYPKELVDTSGVMSTEKFDALARKRFITPWVCMGVVSGQTAVTRVVCKAIKKKIRARGFRHFFFNHWKLAIARGILHLKPFNRLLIRGTLDRLHSTLELFLGKPAGIELSINYWKSGVPLPHDREMDPGRDHTGLFWFSPLVPMKPDSVRKCITFITATCRAHQIEPLITITSLSGICLDMTVSILFNAQQEDEVARAHACYAALFKEGKKLGFVPYRIGIDFMPLIEEEESGVWEVVNLIKNALDPEHIIAPGRYSSSRSI
uniref:FAD/FMN-containing dehydrogenase n=1 Tax=uncultured bacterium CSLC2 TaxID=1091571 RepID=Q8KP03_9BACT|nr:FAD/FMN-containing dehydrogenase [uncultured bacterium CSLC2]